MISKSRHRLAVASRVLAAIVGGYAVAALVSGALAVVLPMTRAEATVTATLTSFIVYAVAVMGVSAARSAVRAWLWLAGFAALAGGVWLGHARFFGALS